MLMMLSAINEAGKSGLSNAARPTKAHNSNCPCTVRNSAFEASRASCTNFSSIRIETVDIIPSPMHLPQLQLLCTGHVKDPFGVQSSLTPLRLLPKMREVVAQQLFCQLTIAFFERTYNFQVVIHRCLGVFFGIGFENLFILKKITKVIDHGDQSF